MYITAGSTIDFVAESKVRYSEVTISDSPNRTVTLIEPYTLYPECRKESMLCYKASGPILSMY